MAGVKSVVCAAAALAAGFAFAEDPYIESDGNEGFDTGYCFGPNTKIELDCQLTDVEANKGKNLIGVYVLSPENTNPDKPRFLIYIGGHDESAREFSLETSDAAGRQQAWNNYPADTKRHVFVVDFSATTNHFKIFTDGVRVYESGGVYSNFPSATSQTTIGLFTSKYGNTLRGDYMASMKVYGLKIYEKVGGAYELQKNFVPEQVGLVAGFRETESGAFFTTEDRTGLSFTKGGGYVESEYTDVVEALNFNTGYFIGPNTKIRLDFQLTSIVPDCAMLGILDPAPSRGNKVWCTLGVNGVGDKLKFSGAWNDGTTSKELFAIDTKRKIITMDFPAASGKQFSIYDHGDMPGVSNYSGAQVTNNSNTAALPLGLFNRCDASNAASRLAFPYSTPAKMKVYGLQIYEKVSGEYVLKKNFVPCLKGDIPGFKETSSGMFSTGMDVSTVKYGGDILEEPDDPYVALDYPDHASGNRPVGERLFFTPNDKIGPESRIEFDHALLNQPGLSGNAYLFCSYSHYDNKTMGVYASGGHYGFTINGSAKYNPADIGDVQYMLMTNAYGIRRTVVLDKNSIRFITAGYTNAVKTVTSAQSVTNEKFVIGNYNDYQRSMPMRIYGYSIYTNGVLQKDYRPYVTNGVPGMLDILSDNWTFPYTEAPNATNRLVAVAGGDLTHEDSHGFIGCTDGSDEAYLEFPGTDSGINTGRRVTPNSCIEADIALWNTANLTNAVQQLLYQASGTYVRLDADKNSNGANLKWLYRDYVSPFTYNDTGVNVSNRRMQYSLDNHLGTVSLKCGGETLYSATMPSPATNSGGNSGYGNNLIVGKANAHIRVYGLKIFEYVNGVKTTRQDFVPFVTNGIAGLYDRCGTGFYPLTNSLGEAIGKVSGIGTKNVDGEKVEIMDRPDEEVTLVCRGAGRTTTLVCRAAGAQSYEWYADGVRVEGESGSMLTVNWMRCGLPNYVIYSVVPVYELFNETVRGAAVETRVDMPPSGMVQAFK